MTSQKEIKAGVIAFGKEIEAKYGVKLSHQWLLEQTAKHLAGVSHWGVMKGALPEETVVVDRALAFDGSEEEPSDYKLQADHDSCWIKVDSIAVYVRRTDEGVVVDLFAQDVCEQSIGSTYAFFTDAEAEFAEFNDIELDDVAEWVAQQSSVVFDQESPASRFEWLKRYQAEHVSAEPSVDRQESPVIADEPSLTAISLLSHLTNTHRADWFEWYHPAATAFDLRFVNKDRHASVVFTPGVIELIKVKVDGNVIWSGPLESAIAEVPEDWKDQNALSVASLKTTYGKEHPWFTKPIFESPYSELIGEFSYWDWVSNRVNADQGLFVLYSSKNGFWDASTCMWEAKESATRYSRKQLEELVFLGKVPEATGFDHQWLDV